jgi:hypothetical protein
VHLTIIGEPIAHRIYGFGIWTSTRGQDPPGKEKVDAKMASAQKKPFFERMRPYLPPGWLERRGRPFSTPVRIVWFVLVGWWLGAVWVVIAWSPFLLPYRCAPASCSNTSRGARSSAHPAARGDRAADGAEVRACARERRAWSWSRPVQSYAAQDDCDERTTAEPALTS